MIPAGFMAGNYVARHFGRKMSIDKMIRVGATATVIGISFAIALQLAGIHDPLALFAPVAIATFGNGITLPNAQAAAINEFPQYAGSASGLTGFLQMSVSAIAAQLVALIFNGTVYPLLLLMLAAAILSLFLFNWGIGSASKA
jgi:DHA1 family bicyclomycin/chloramphenicol resistance-like MFS transporter